MRGFYLLVLLALVSCRKDASLEVGDVEPFKPAPCEYEISYSQEIKAELIDISCNVSNCHDQSAAGGLELTTHAQVATNTHIMWFTMVHDSASVPMPSAYERIPDSLLQKFHCWISQGKPDN